MRASVAAEALGFPSASIVCKGFAVQGSAVAAGSGLPGLPVAEYPGHVNLHSADELRRNVETVLVDQIVQNLTVQPEVAGLSSEPSPAEVVVTGTLEQVNDFFYERGWSEGLPVMPPTRDRVEAFLQFTGRSPDEVIGILLPDRREATVWNVAVNGVMAGCRPEYMPVLIAMVEAMADPQFAHEHISTTSGPEVMITINGPLIKDLGFNYEQGALRVGFHANTSVGRFWRLYLRNVAGLLPHKTDKATFGGTWRVVLAENEDVLARVGWESTSVDQGLQPGDNAITLCSCSSTDSVVSVGAATAEGILDKIAARVVDTQLMLFKLSFGGRSVRPQILMSPCVAEALSAAGYSKQKVRQYLYEHATFPARRFEQLWGQRWSLCAAVEERDLPKLYCESSNPDRLVPIVWQPEDFLITVSGDPDRDNCFVCAQNGFIGYPTTRRIALPSNWNEMLNESKISRRA